MVNKEDFSSKIYVVIPIYNVEQELSRCLESLIRQTYQNFQAILIDDGATDSSGLICDYYASRYENLMVIHKVNGGLSSARNVGLEYVLDLEEEDAWVTFIDSDDYIHPKYLECLLYAAKDGNTEISCCAYKEVNGEEICDRVEDLKHNIDGIYMMGKDKDVICGSYNNYTPEKMWLKNRTNAVVAWGKLYKASIFGNIRYPLNRLNEDEFTTHLLLFRQEKIAYISHPLYYYYRNPDSITKREWTPKRIDGIDGLEEQVIFLKEHGFKKAYERSYKELCMRCISALHHIRVSSPQFDELKWPLLKRAIRFLWIYGKDFGYGKCMRKFGKYCVPIVPLKK